MYDHEEYYSDYYTETSSSTYETEEEDYYPDDFEEEEPISTIDETVYDDTIVYTEWRLIKIGDTTLRLSNTGKVQYTDISIFHITKGVKEPGTPYRYVLIENKKYYLHQLIWQAFYREEVPPGYEVRHDNAPFDEEGCYSNELRYLDIFEDTIQPIRSLRRVMVTA